MRIKRVLQGTALTALAAAAWMGAGSADASAAVDISLQQSEDDYSYQLSVDATEGEHEIMAAVVKPNKQGKFKVSAWDVYESNSAYIDLSKLNVTKDNYIAIKTDKMAKPDVVEISAASKKNKVKFNAGTSKISEFTVDAGQYKGSLEYRTVTGNWSEMNLNDDLSGYQYQGATLYLRVPAAPAKNEATLKTVTDITDNKDNTETITVKNVGSLPSKEVKLNIGKQANGPKVAVDYVKGIVTIPKNTEYRVVVEGIVGPTTGAVQKDTATPGAILGTAKEGVLEVRKAPVTTTAKGKAGSKWTRVKLEKPVAAGITAATNITTGPAVSVTVSTAGSVNVKYVESRGKINGFSIENKTSVTIDYCVGTPSSDGKGFKALKKDKSATIKKDISGKEVYIRIAGIKNEKKWAGAWEKLADVKF